MGVVVVGVPHRPSADVSAGVLTVTAVYKAVVTVRPFLEIVHLTHHGQRAIIDVPLVRFLGAAVVERGLIARFLG